MEKCKICGKEFDSLKGLSNHILRIHKISIQSYYDRYNSKGICLVCGKPTKFKNLNYGYNKTCCIECNNIYSNRRREETNLKIFKCKCLKCNHKFMFGIQGIRTYAMKKNPTELCPYCNPRIKQISSGEKEIVEYIKSIYSDDILENDKQILNRL